MTKKKCIQCSKNSVSEKDHDLCTECWNKLIESERGILDEDRFTINLESGEVYTVYVMYYDTDKFKVGYTKDLTSRLFELKRLYPKNKLAYFREFSKESSARRYEAWMKQLSDRQVTRIVGIFLGRINRIEKEFR